MTLVNFLINKLDDLKASNIICFDVSGRSSITDAMIVCTGNSSRHVSALAQNLLTDAKKAGFEPFGDEGKETADWVVVDFGQAIVHILQQESRDLYQLEKLWSE